MAVIGHESVTSVANYVTKGTGSVGMGICGGGRSKNLATLVVLVVNNNRLIQHKSMCPSMPASWDWDIQF